MMMQALMKHAGLPEALTRPLMQTAMGCMLLV